MTEMTDMQMDHQQRNSENLQALIDYAAGHPDPVKNTIGYIQAAQFVLLGKGHSASDIQRIASVQGDWKAKGKIAIEINKTKKETKLVFRIDPEEKHVMHELEVAIEAAVAGTNMNGAKIETSWLK